MSNILIALYVVTTSLGLVFIKLGSSEGAAIDVIDSKPALNLGIHTILGVILYGLSFLLYTYLIAKFELGYIVPLTTALVYLVVFTASYFVFNESFTAMKVAAIGLILVGVTLLNGSTART